MPTTTRKKPAEKAQERLQLHAEQTITIKISASEHNLQRLTALLLFAEVPVKFEEEPMTKLPWEDPESSEFQVVPQVEIDYDVVTRSIVKSLGEYVTRFGENAARAMLRDFGGERLSQIGKEKLLDLERTLRESLESTE